MTAHDPYPFSKSTITGAPADALGRIDKSVRRWRILRTVLAVLGLLALIEAIIIMTFMIALAGNLGSELDRLGDPDPVVTGCPFGEVECGG